MISARDKSAAFPRRRLFGRFLRGRLPCGRLLLRLRLGGRPAPLSLGIHGVGIGIAIQVAPDLHVLEGETEVAPRHELALINAGET